MNLANGEIARWRDRFFLQREKEKKRLNWELRNENERWIKNVRWIENENSNVGIYKKFLGFGNFLDGKIPKIPLILFIPDLLNPFNPVHPRPIKSLKSL